MKLKYIKVGKVKVGHINLKHAAAGYCLHCRLLGQRKEIG